MSEMSQGKPTVLIADNKRIDAACLKLLLERDGFQVEIVEYEDDVLEKIKNQSYYAILLANQSFNNLNGIEVTKKIRDYFHKVHTHMPIIGLASSAIQAEMRGFLAAGADACLAKPVYKNELYDVLKQTLKKVRV
ncbi:MAG: response regulator [Cytophagales bacterium]|nr:response regulator [Cytophagales bacterium]MDW8385150.1 response regulator [Flammeovirgaceae bacterium]